MLELCTIYFERDDDTGVIIKQANALINFDQLIFPKINVNSDEKTELEFFFFNFMIFISVLQYLLHTKDKKTLF